MLNNQIQKPGFDSEGFPITAGGERITSANVRSQDKYVQERQILSTYNQIKNLHSQLKAPQQNNQQISDEQVDDTNGTSFNYFSGSVNRQKIQKMRDSLGENGDDIPHFGPPKSERQEIKLTKLNVQKRLRKGRSQKSDNSGDQSRSRSRSNEKSQLEFSQEIEKNQNPVTDQETNFESANQGEVEFRAPLVALVRESLQLTDNEVTLTFMKFMIGVAILNFPAQAKNLGIFNGFLSTAIIVFLVAKSLENLVKAIPLSLMNQNLTYGQLVKQTYGQQQFQDITDIIVILCQSCNYMLYLKYVGDQMNQIVCQETDNRFCGETNLFLAYYYIPVTIIVLMLSQLKNYKQLSYLVKIAMIATAIAIFVILYDSILQLLLLLRLRYSNVQYGENKDQAQQLEITFLENHQKQSFNFFMPFYPFFMDCFCKIQVSFEGAPIVPKLYTSAQNKHYFVRNLNRAVLIIGIIQALFGILCVYAYNDKLQEIVLMSLHYGLFSNFVKLLYSIGMVVNLVLQLVPILEIVETRQPSIFGYGTSPNENKDKNVHIYLFDPNQQSKKQQIQKFWNSLFFVLSLLIFTMFLDQFHLLLLIDGALLTNILVITLPNALYLHQCNYGYLKKKESRENYMFAILMFYLSLFNLIYALFRVLQQSMGVIGVNSIIK